MAVKRWTGSTWEIYAGADTSPGFAATDGRAGRRTWVGANTPTAPTDGDIWIDQDTATNSIPASAFDAKGDLMVGTGPDTYTRQAVGTDGQILVADSTQADGVVWSHSSARMGLVNMVPTSIAVGSGSASASANGAVTFSAVSSISLNGCFNTNYDNYRVVFKSIINIPGNGTNELRLRLRTSSGDDSSNIYNGGYSHVYYGGTTIPIAGGVQPGTYFPLNTAFYNLGSIGATLDIVSINGTTAREFYGVSNGGNGASGSFGPLGGGTYSTSNVHTGVTFYSSSTGTLTGTIRIYGYNNGA